jgi:hypothetical protein
MVVTTELDHLEIARRIIRVQSAGLARGRNLTPEEIDKVLEPFDCERARRRRRVGIGGRNSATRDRKAWVCRGVLEAWIISEIAAAGEPLSVTELMSRGSPVSVTTLKKLLRRLAALGSIAARVVCRVTPRPKALGVYRARGHRVTVYAPTAKGGGS